MKPPEIKALEITVLDGGTDWVFSTEARVQLEKILTDAGESGRLSMAKEMGITSGVGDPIFYQTTYGWRYAYIDEKWELTSSCVESFLRGAHRRKAQPVVKKTPSHNHELVGMFKSLHRDFEGKLLELRKEFWKRADIKLAVGLRIFGFPDPIFSRMMGCCPLCGEELMINSVEGAVAFLCEKTISLEDIHWKIGAGCLDKNRTSTSIVEASLEKAPTVPAPRKKEEKTEVYIQNLSSPFFKCLKVGIAKDTKKRMKQQQRAGMFKHNILCAFEFDSRERAIKVESEIKAAFQRSICLPEWLPDGWTETFLVEDYQKVFDMCVSNKGVLKQEKK